MNIADFYDKRCQPNVKPWEVCHWQSRESQQNNYDLLLQISAIGPTDTILDVGCGLGDFHLNLKKLGLTKYTGIDVSPKMIYTANRRFPNTHFQVADVSDVEGKWDWVFASGTFNHVGQDLDAAIRKLFSLARNGVGLNVLSKFDPTSVKMPCEYLQCHDPVKALETAFSLTRWVNMNHTALDWGFVLFLYTDEFAG
jgi:cyclopropane fatty-acyl-phospholipid synthase-like methyltransferase